MSTTTFELTDFTAPAYLHFNHEKFWEIKLKQDANETCVRCGKLNGKDEDTTTLQTLTKNHPNLGEAITYMEKHVNLKLGKGYRFFKREPEKPIIMDIEPRQVSRETSRNTTAWSINIIPPSSNQSGGSGNGLKRREEESLVREDLKQTKYDRNEWEDRNDRNDRIEEETNPYPLPQMTGDKDLDEAIALSILEEARKKKLGKRGGDHSNGFSDTRSNGFGGASASNHVSNGDGFSASIVSASFQVFKGEYMSRGAQFFKIQVLRKHIKIEKGVENGKTEKEFKICMDGNDAIAQAKKHISELEAKGYQSKTSKFAFDFNDNELNFQRTSHHAVPRSAPVSRGASPNDSRNDLNVGDDDEDDDNRDRLGIDRDDYSNTSRRSAYWDLDEEQKGSGRSKPRSASFSQADNDNKDDDDDENDEDYDGGAPADLGPDPLGKPVTKNYTSVLLAHKWENEDPTGWFMSEKLDGVRCFWNGRTMWSRNGKQYFPPKFFVKDFPKSPLDGELWTGRSTFQKCVSYVRKQNPIDSEWRNVKYMVFDAPELKMPFKDRFKKMKEVFGKIKCPYIELLDHRLCKGRSDLNEELAVVQNVGGEGLMIRNPTSFYENRRSRTLLKVKTFDDDEATIIGHEPGSGKYINMTGALRVRNGAGIEFSVGSGLNDAMRARPPKIGVKITYKHQGVSNRGVPRFPTFLRIYQGD